MIAAAAVLAAFLLVSVVFAIAEHRRRIQVLSFRCRRCDREFRRSPHRGFARACPGCGARDWANPA